MHLEGARDRYNLMAALAPFLKAIIALIWVGLLVQTTFVDFQKLGAEVVENKGERFLFQANSDVISKLAQLAKTP